MRFQFHTPLAVTAFGICGAVLGIGSPSPAQAQAISYPWCTVGEDVLCYYDTQQQCEEEVDYHGFCEPNPDYHPQGSSSPQRAQHH
jgi:hypothetical protein